MTPFRVSWDNGGGKQTGTVRFIGFIGMVPGGFAYAVVELDKNHKLAVIDVGSLTVAHEADPSWRGE